MQEILEGIKDELKLQRINGEVIFISKKQE